MAWRCQRRPARWTGQSGKPAYPLATARRRDSARERGYDVHKRKAPEFRRLFQETRDWLHWARQCRMRKRGLVREAESAIDGIGLGPHFEPLQQRYVLRVIGKDFVTLAQSDGHRCIREHFDGIALFQVVLADLRVRGNARELP